MSPLSTTGVIQAATVITAAEGVMGGEIECGAYDSLTLFLDYVNGDETSVAVIAKTLRVSEGTEYPDVAWSAAAGAKTATANSYTMDATANRVITFDIRGVEIIKFYQDATGGTPTGTLAAAYSMTRDG